MNTSIRDLPELPILIIDDEEHALQSFEVVLRSGGMSNIMSCQESQDVMPLLSEQPIELMLLDLWMPHVSGEEILEYMLKEFPDVPVIIVTGVNEVDTAVKCMRSGAFDYLVKPIEKERLLSSVTRALELRALRRENASLKDRLLSTEVGNPGAFSAIITGNDKMEALFKYIEAISKTSQSVLITGETGVGKELFARAVHYSSGRAGEFVAVNVAGLDDNAFSDTLFGHQKGAFTSADQTRVGLIEKAAGGTLFLDEIGDLSSASQIKLLRFLQEREYLPLGSDMPKRTDARVVVATNFNFHESQQTGGFRKDLFYRLRTHHVHIPPLRERLDDLPFLVDYFVEEACNELEKKHPRVPEELFILLGTYSFPGNVRELRSLIFDALSSHKSGTISLESFELSIGRSAEVLHYDVDSFPHSYSDSFVFPDELPTLRQSEKMLITEALRRARGNQGIAAGILGITRQALNQRLKRSERLKNGPKK